MLLELDEVVDVDDELGLELDDLFSQSSGVPHISPAFKQLALHLWAEHPHMPPTELELFDEADVDDVEDFDVDDEEPPDAGSHDLLDLQ